MRDLKDWLMLIFQRPGRLTVGGAFMLATLLSGIALLAVSGWFITETALVGILLAAGVAATINLYVPGGAIRLFAVSRTVFRYLERVYNHDTVLRLLTDIRVSLFQKLSGKNRRHRSDLRAAQWLSRLTSDVDALDTLYLRLIAPTALAALVAVMVALLTGLIFNAKAGLTVGLALLAAFLVATLATYLSTQKLVARRSDQQESLRTALIEHVEGFAELTAAGRAGKHGARLRREARQITTEQANADSRVGWHQAITQLLVNLAAVVALWFGFTLFQADFVSGPVLVLVPIALLGVSEVFMMLPDAFGKLGATRASAERLNRDCKASVQDDSRPNQQPSDGAALAVRDLAVKHPGHAPLLTHFDLKVMPGERIGIIGHSGSGKSSLADTLAGLLPPSHGELLSLRQAYLTQATVLFDDTLRTNLLLGCSDATDTELWSMLEKMELAERFSVEPDQLDTWLGSNGSRLSGGEARRVVLARVLLSGAPVILLDEPFTGLDKSTRKRVSKQMDAILEGKTVISLAHGPDALPGTDRVITLPT